MLLQFRKFSLKWELYKLSKVEGGGRGWSGVWKRGCFEGVQNALGSCEFLNLFWGNESVSFQ